MAAVSVLRSPVRMCSLNPGNRFGSPAKRFAMTPSINDKTTAQDHDNGHYKALSQQMSISEDDREVIALLKTISQKKEVPYLDRFLLYESVMQVYEAASNGESVPLTLKAHLESDGGLKRRIYRMVYDVLHHKEIIEDMLIDSSFYSSHFDLHHYKSLVLVMAYDFQNGKFAIRLPKEEVDNLPINVVKVAKALWEHKIKLGASLARMRVKEDARSVTLLIPDSGIRQRYERTNEIPYCTRMNLGKVNKTHKDILAQLQEEGFTVVQYQRDLCRQRRSVYQPRRDLLIFSPDSRECVDGHELVTNGHLIVQDLARYYAVEQLRCYIEQCNGDILLTNCNSGTDILQVALILGRRGTVIAFDVTPSRVQLLNSKLSQLGLNNVQLIDAPFSAACPSDKSLEDVKLLISLPTTSHLPSVTHQVDYVIHEGDEYLTTLCPVSTSTRTVSRKSSTPTTGAQSDHISLALTFDQAEHIIYLCSSQEEADGKALLKRVLEQHKIDSMGDDAEKLLKKDQSRYTVTVLDRQQEKPGPTPRDVIARAVAKGLINIGEDGDIISPQKQITKPKKINRIFALHNGIPTTIPAQRKEGKKKDHQSPKRPFR